MASLAPMAYLVRDCDSKQALKNEDGDHNRNRKHCRMSSHHRHQDAEPKAAPTTRDQEGDMGLSSSG